MLDTSIVRKELLLASFVLLPIAFAGAQAITRYTYHDASKKNLKEIYQVKDTVSNILQGRYISYFLNGHIESKGQFVNNETTGVWEFYYETGNLKMRGILRQNSNYGLWEYYYENGQKSMEGTIDGKLKEGNWKIYYESGELKEQGEYVANKRSGLWNTFFEDGSKRGEIEYEDDHGRYTEFYQSGKVFAEGPRSGAKNVGHWRLYAEDGTLESEGDYNNGKKNGEWKFYYPSGKNSSIGNYENDIPVGQWLYYFENGSVSSKGVFVSGKKNGYWSTFNKDGSVKSEITYANGSGDYREYYPSHKLKVKGQLVDGKDQGGWQYFYEDGKLEGECEFDKGKGIYLGYYPDGSLQTKGQIENDLRVGTWELYEQDGKLSGYYKPFYEDKNLANAINALAERSKVPNLVKPRKSHLSYFSPRYPEYHSVIIQGNPAFMFVGSLPMGVEFYNEARLGHEFSFEGIRDPFFTADGQVPIGKLYKRGYAISLKQKFYNPVNFGMWYFAHEIRFTNIVHYSNERLPGTTNMIIGTASEQRVEYGVLLGVRLMQRLDRNGFTIDSFIGYNAGYRSVAKDPQFESVFSTINTNHFSQTFRIGLNFGYSFSFEGRKY